MGFLRRLLGGLDPAGREPEPGQADGDRATDAAEGDADLDEEARLREILLADARRLDDDLLQRQLRYADRSWTPPAQGGSRRADDEEAQGG